LRPNHSGNPKLDSIARITAALSVACAPSIRTNCQPADDADSAISSTSVSAGT